jgi:hypothetical protein
MAGPIGCGEGAFPGTVLSAGAGGAQHRGKEAVMRTMQSIAVAAALAAAATLAAGCDSSAEAKSKKGAQPTLDEILTQHFDAQGGLEALKGAKTVTFTAVERFDGKETRIACSRMRPNYMHYDINGADGHIQKGFDGTQGWFSKDGKAELVRAEKLAGMKAKAEFDDALIDWQKRGNKVTLVGQVDLDGAKAWQIDVTLANGDSESRYIDAATMLETKRVMKWSYEGKSGEKAITFSDYRKVDGIVTNHGVGWEKDGKKGTLTFESIRWNAEVKVALFAPPAGATLPVAAPAAATAAPAKAASK